jgi:two-component system cell cycle response regulator
VARVLVIEDNPASLDLMVYLLKAFGHTPLSARDGLQGIEEARKEQPDLILCDIQLPGADGVEVCRRLKQDPNLKDIQIIAVTAYAMVGDREKLLANGFNGYLSKPINPQTFIEQMAPYLSIRRNHSASVSPVEQARVTVTRARILVVDNSPANIHLSRSMLEPFGYQIIEARSVDDALKALTEPFPDVILSDLHMPDKDGFDFIEIVKANPELRKIPFLFISSTMLAERERELALYLGAERFLLRPIEPPALINEIEACRSKGKSG